VHCKILSYWRIRSFMLVILSPKYIFTFINIRSALQCRALH
jgi:hypothetical protein